MSNDIETEEVRSFPYGRRGEKLKNLNAEAWDLLLRQYAGDLRQDIQLSLRKRRLSVDLTDDIEQETWLTAVRKINEFEWENEEKLYYWLRVIAFNHIRTYQRVNNKFDSVDDYPEKGVEAELEHFQNLWNEQERSIEDRIILQELYLSVDRALQTLKPVDQEIFMRWLMGEKPRQLALVYQIKPRTISMMLLRNKEKLKMYLKQNTVQQGEENTDES